MVEQIIPGVQIEVRSEALTTVLPGAIGVIGMVGSADWGPLDEPITVASYAETLTQFGDDSADTTMSRALNLAYANGAQTVRAVRIASSSKAKASQSYKASATPVVTLTALHEGAAGNNTTLSYDQTRLLATLRNTALGVEEVHSASDGAATPAYDADTLVANINANSVLATAVKDTETQPDQTTNDAMTGGDSGTTLTSTDYQNGLALLETVPCNLVNLAGQSSASDATNLKAHTDLMLGQDEERIAFMGGAQGDTIAELNSAMSAIDSDRTVFCGPGIKFVPRFDTTGTLANFGGAFTAAAVMGKVASLDVQASPTNKVLSGMTDTEFFLSKSNVEDLILNRICAVRKDSGIRIQKGITSSSDSAFAQITTRRIVDFSKFGVRSASKQFIGKLNNERVRTALKGTIDNFLDSMIADESITFYKSEVFATRAQEIAGIARVDLTIQPVFSIDFIKVTIFLQ